MWKTQRQSLSLSKKKSHFSLSLRDGSAVGSGVSWPGDSLSRDIISVWAVAYLSGDFHRTHPLLPYLRRLRLLSVFSLSYKQFDSIIQCYVSIYLLIYCFGFWRRFVGAVFGSKGTNVILCVENFCCDRPNPILQVCDTKVLIFLYPIGLF